MKYQEKEYGFSIPAVVELMPKGLKRTLDVGCSGGGLGQYLKNEYAHQKIIGIEYSTIAAKQAKNHLDEVYTGDAAEVILPENYNHYFDIIVYADILEQRLFAVCL